MITLLYINIYELAYLKWDKNNTADVFKQLLMKVGLDYNRNKRFH